MFEVALLDYVQSLYYKNYIKNYVSEAGLCFRLQVKKGKATKTYLLGLVHV
jgi:hypothetical protein